MTAELTGLGTQIPTLEELGDIFTLEAVRGFGPGKFKELHDLRIPLSEVIRRPAALEMFGKRGIDFRKQLEQLGDEGRSLAIERARRQQSAARSHGGSILTYAHQDYPRCLYASNIPIPALYVRGDLNVLAHDRTVACVGSRNIRAPYAALHEAFAVRAVELGYAIVSGFATGADIIGHLAAERSGGKTICVMPSGLDRPFPPEHKEIWQRFLSRPGVVFVSEFGFGVRASALNLRKRNKTIVGLARGVLVSQSAEDGGAMNAYRFAIEQKKRVATFVSDGSRETSGNDLIAGSAEKVRASVLGLDDPGGWSSWLQKL